MDAKTWVVVGLVVLGLVGMVAVGIALVRKPEPPPPQEVTGLFGYPEEAATGQASIVFVERTAGHRLVVIIPGGDPTKIVTVFVFSGELPETGLRVADVNGDGALDIVVDGVYLYNVDAVFSITPPAKSAGAG